MRRNILYYGHELLRRRSKEVEEINDEIKRLAFDLIETMDSLRGIGLAAPQVGVLWRMFVIRPEIESKSGEIEFGEAEIYINPRLSNPSKEVESHLEGCLSIPGFHEEVSRPVSVEIEALGLNGQKIKKEVHGFKARQLMHENDHLNGILFIDRLSKQDKKKLEPALREFQKSH